MALKFLNKKGWHTGSLRNIENVWKAEQKHEAEAKKLEELKKQIQDEREAQEFRLLQEQAGLIPKQERLEFLYDSGLAVGKVSTDEYLLGKPVEPEKAQSEIQKVAATPGSLFVEEKPQSANDQWRKLHSDPLLLIRQQEQAALARIKNNPVKMEMIKKSIVEKISKKEKKHRHKEKKHKEKKRKRKYSSESEESMEKQNKDKEKNKADDVNDGYKNSRKEGREAEHIQHISRNEHPKRRHDTPDSERETRQNAFKGHGSPRRRHDSPDHFGERWRDANGRQRSPRRGHASPDSVGRNAYTRQESPRKRHDSPDYVAEQKRDGYARNQSIKAARSSKEQVSSKQSTENSDERHDNRSSPKRGFNRHGSRNPDGGEPKHDTRREDESGKMRMSFKEHDLTKAKNNIQQERYDRSRSPRRMSRSPRKRENYSRRHDDSPRRESRSRRSRSPRRNQYERRRGSPDVSDIDRPGLRSSKNKEIADDPKVEANGREGVGLSTSELNRQSNKYKVGKLSEEEKAERLRAMQMDAEIHEEQRWHRLKKASDADKLEEARATINKGKNFLDATARNIYGAAAEGKNNASVEESVRRRAHFIKRSIGDSNENTFQRS